MEIMTWQDHAGGVVVKAQRAGFLDLPGLKELVAWLDGGELPRLAPDMLDNVPESEYTQRVNVLTKGEILRCTSNLWLRLIGRACVPAKHVRGEPCFAPVLVGGLLADDPRMRPDRLFKHSVEAGGADAGQYARLVKAADMDCSAAACRILAEKIEPAAAPLPPAAQARQQARAPAQEEKAKGKAQDGEDDSAILTQEDVAILRELANRKTAVKQSVLVRVKEIDCSEKTLGQRIKQLRDLGYTTSVKGGRSGEAITVKGHARLARIPAD
jgi:hypothetical protein